MPKKNKPKADMIASLSFIKWLCILDGVAISFLKETVSYTAVSAPDGHNLAINSWSHYLPTCVQDEDGWCHGKKELIAYWVQVPWSHGARKHVGQEVFSFVSSVHLIINPCKIACC